MRWFVFFAVVAALGTSAAFARIDVPNLPTWTPTPESVRRVLNNRTVKAWQMKNISQSDLNLKVVANIILREEDGNPIWVLQSVGIQAIIWTKINAKTAARSPLDVTVLNRDTLSWAKQMDFFYREKPWLFHAWSAVAENVDDAQPFQAKVIIPEGNDHSEYEYFFVIDALQGDKLIRCTVDPDFNIVSVEDFPASEADAPADETP